MEEDLRLPVVRCAVQVVACLVGSFKRGHHKSDSADVLRYAIESKSHLHMAVQLEISKQQKSVERHVSLALRKKGKKGVKT